MHTVATGIIIQLHGNIFDLISFVCRNVTYKGEFYSGNRIRKLMGLSTGIESCLDFLDLKKLKDFTFELYDDIKNIGGELVYKEDTTIKIGQPHGCAVMIYINCVSDEETSNDVSDDTWLNLIIWKKALQSMNRLEKDATIASIKNCC